MQKEIFVKPENMPSGCLDCNASSGEGLYCCRLHTEIDADIDVTCERMENCPLWIGYHRRE